MSPKEEIRGEIKNRLKTVGREELLSQGRAAAGILSGSSIWTSHKTLLVFLSLKSEIDTQLIIENALNEGKKVFAPKVKKETLVFIRVHSAEGPWHSGPFGIREPREESNTEADILSGKDFPALIITPGIAFDNKGNRLGRGGGFYDRFFSELDAEGRHYSSIGLCMDFQIIGKVPAGERDKKVSSVLTGKDLISIKT